MPELVKVVFDIPVNDSFDYIDEWCPVYKKERTAEIDDDVIQILDKTFRVQGIKKAETKIATSDNPSFITRMLSQIASKFDLPKTLIMGLKEFVELFEGWLKIGTMVQGASLLIVVGVVLDTVSQIEGYLTTHRYEGFLTGQRKGRRRR